MRPSPYRACPIGCLRQIHGKQRSIDHWQAIKQDIRDKVSFLGDQDDDALFAYLEVNFSDQQPAPWLPPEFQGLGCSSGVR